MEVKEKVILLVEENPDDVELTRRALKKSRVANELVVAGFLLIFHSHIQRGRR